ncbi:MAG: right-handed parallel beta-helix repeat-containing protein [Thermoproteota archaeon]|nr:right-handed parallel beta-helix repeat-containing protein [Thermoproteota archaeon]
MVIFKKGFFVGASAVIAFLISSTTVILTLPIQFTDASTSCVGYQSGVNTITVTCDASFQDVAQAINDPNILEQEEGQEGQYVLNANLEVADGVNFEMTSSGDGLRYLKIAGENGLIVYGKILIDGIIITSWDISDEEVIGQDMNGTIRRGYVQFAASEGSQIINSEFGYLGDVEPGRRGFDLFGGGGPSHDMEVRGSKFHDMWFAFYSNGAYNITVDGNEYYNNIKYALDPHTTTHDMIIRNNWLHHNPIGAICSDRCYNILIEGNLAEHNTNSGIFLSRNMTNSIVRNNQVSNTSTGILLSESPNNQVYNNIIDGATDEGILLFNPDIPDDGSTQGNIIYDNAISNSDDGIRATRSQNNIVENTTFTGIESSEYRVSGNSGITIRGQEFDDAIITGDAEGEAGEEGEMEAEDDQPVENVVEIVGSGIIDVTEGADNGGGEEEDGEEDDENGGDEDEGSSHNTDVEPYTAILGDGDSITINS